MSEMEMHIFKKYNVSYKPKHDIGETVRIPGWGHITYMGKVVGDGWSDICKQARKVLGPHGMNQGEIKVAYSWTKSDYGYLATFKNGIPDEKWPSAEDHGQLNIISHMIHTIDSQ